VSHLCTNYKGKLGVHVRDQSGTWGGGRGEKKEKKRISTSPITKPWQFMKESSRVLFEKYQRALGEVEKESFPEGKIPQEIWEADIPLLWGGGLEKKSRRLWGGEHELVTYFLGKKK